MARANLIKDWNPDNPEMGLTRANHQYCCDDSITQGVSPDGNGKALHYLIRGTDMVVSSSIRAELQLSTPEAPETSERWYGLRYFIESFPAASGASLLQWHDTNGTTPPLSIQVAGNSLRVTQSMPLGNTYNEIGNFELNKAIDIILHIKWAVDKTGLIEVWKDGKLVMSKSGIITNSKGGSYLKCGSNSFDIAPPFAKQPNVLRKFWITQFRIGNEKATFADVAPDNSVVVVPPVTTDPVPPVTPPPTKEKTITKVVNKVTTTVYFSDNSTQVFES